MPNGTWPNGILVDGNATIWTVGTKSQNLLRIDPKNGRLLASYPLNNQDGLNKNLKKSRTGVMMVWAIVEGKDGSIWFSQSDSSNPLWRFDIPTSKFEVFRSISGPPFQMRVDEKTGNIWFTTFASGTIGVIQRDASNNSGYVITEFPLGRESYPSGLFLDGDAVWVTQTLNDKIVNLKILKDNHGKVINLVKVLEISGRDKKNLFSAPYDVVRLNNTLWITEHDANFISKYDLISKAMTKVAVSNNPHQYISLPFWLRIGPHGKDLWFNEHTGNRMSLMNTTELQLTEYEIPTRDPSTGYISNVLNFIVDPLDRNRVWFSEYNYDKIGILDRHVSIPFAINSNQSDIIISTDKDQKFPPKSINFELLKVPNKVPYDSSNSNSNETIVTFKASSSMSEFGSLKNITTEFFPQSINISKSPERVPIQLKLTLEKDKEIVPGNYTLGIGASDGLVTTSVFQNLLIK
jgi:streptogramin lyase